MSFRVECCVYRWAPRSRCPLSARSIAHSSYGNSSVASGAGLRPPRSTSAAVQLREYRRPQRLALLFGAEDFGLSPETLNACDDLVKIAMQAGVDSLNVGDAAAIFLYELCCVQQHA